MLSPTQYQVSRCSVVFYTQSASKQQPQGLKNETESDEYCSSSSGDLRLASFTPWDGKSFVL